jgi:hypothetical protein
MGHTSERGGARNSSQTGREKWIGFLSHFGMAPRCVLHWRLSYGGDNVVINPHGMNFEGHMQEGNTERTYHHCGGGNSSAPERVSRK